MAQELRGCTEELDITDNITSQFSIIHKAIRRDSALQSPLDNPLGAATFIIRDGVKKVLSLVIASNFV